MSFNSIKAAREAARLTAWKDPVRVAVETSEVTMSGEQTAQGVALVVGDSVLVIDGVEGGIRTVQTGAWARREDAKTSGALRTGTTVRVLEGDYAGEVWKLETTGTIEPGATSMTWSADTGGGGGATTTDALTAKLAVRTRSTSTTIPASTGTHGGVGVLHGERVLLSELTTQADRGIYAVNGFGTWARASDFNSSADIANGALVYVAQGTDAGKLYALEQLGATLGTASLSFRKVSDVDLTDTTVFSSAGVASRAVVTSVGGNITAAGGLYGQFLSTSGAGTLTVGTLNQTGLTMGRSAAPTAINGSTVTITSGDEVYKLGAGTYVVAGTQTAVDGSAHSVAEFSVPANSYVSMRGRLTAKLGANYMGFPVDGSSADTGGGFVHIRQNGAGITPDDTTSPGWSALIDYTAGAGATSTFRVRIATAAGVVESCTLLVTVATAA